MNPTPAIDALDKAQMMLTAYGCNDVTFLQLIRSALTTAPEIEPVHAEILASAVYHTTKGTSYNHILNTINGIAAIMPHGIKIIGGEG